MEIPDEITDTLLKLGPARAVEIAEYDYDEILENLKYSYSEGTETSFYVVDLPGVGKMLAPIGATENSRNIAMAIAGMWNYFHEICNHQV